jgi:hypothetical protein
MFLYLDVQFISFPTILTNIFIIYKEYSLISKNNKTYLII